MIIMGVLGIILNIIMQNRTTFFILLAGMFVVLLHMISINSYEKNVKYVIAVTITIFILFLISALIAKLNNFDIAELGDLIFKRSESVTETDRYEYWSRGIENIFNYPFGGGGLDTSFSSLWYHNLWLDVIRVTGIAPVFILILYQILHVKDIFNIYKKSNNDKIKIIIMSLFIFILITYMSAPVLDIAPMLFILTIFYFGIVKNISQSLRSCKE
jgi:hypothetical protein